MPNIDSGRFLRLKAAIEGTLRVESQVTSATALEQAAMRYQAAIAEILPEDLRTEFNALFGGRSGRVRPGLGGDLLGSAMRANAAREELLAMAGWLNGLVESRGS